MQTPSTAPAGNPALRQGLIFGVGLGIIDIIINAITSFANPGGAGIIFSIISIVVVIIAYLVAGMRASQQTGKVGTGALAGLWTGLFSSIISAIFTVIFTLLNLNHLTQVAQQAANQAAQSGQHITISSQFMLMSSIGVAVGSIVLALLFGAGIGALGGLIGKNRASIPVQPYQEAMFQPPDTNA